MNQLMNAAATDPRPSTAKNDKISCINGARRNLRHFYNCKFRPIAIISAQQSLADSDSLSWPAAASWRRVVPSYPVALAFQLRCIDRPTCWKSSRSPNRHSARTESKYQSNRTGRPPRRPGRFNPAKSLTAAGLDLLTRKYCAIQIYSASGHNDKGRSNEQENLRHPAFSRTTKTIFCSRGGRNEKPN